MSTSTDVIPLRNPLRSANLDQLIKFLHSVDNSERANAAAALGEKGQKARDAVEKLLFLLGDPDPRVRFFAAQSLGSICLQPETVVPNLLRVITGDESEEDSRSLSSASFRALVKFGLSYPEEVLPLLLSELGEDAEKRQLAVSKCLMKIGSTKRKVLKRYLEGAAKTPALRDSAQALLCELEEGKLVNS